MYIFKNIFFLELQLTNASSSKGEESSLTRSIMEDHTIGEISPGSISSNDSFTTQFGEPKFTLPLNDINVRETEELQLKCVVTGEPVPTVHWTYNGKTIQADNR